MLLDWSFVKVAIGEIYGTHNRLPMYCKSSKDCPVFATTDQKEIPLTID